MKEYFKVNKNGFVNTQNYCGTWEHQTLIGKVVPIQKIFPGINKGCYNHDSRYYNLFQKYKKVKMNIFKVLFIKLLIDILFYFEMLKFSVKLQKRLLIQRWIVATLFFIIVVLATPYYAYVFSKRE